MRNRAKCKLCGSVIESFHQHDYVICQCGEIAISGGEIEFIASSHNDYKNFLRVDDLDNEIIVNAIEKDGQANSQDTHNEPFKAPTRDEFINELERMIKSDEQLPEKALYQAASFYDILRYMLVISNILKKGN
jgi:hypothetical protein